MSESTMEFTLQQVVDRVGISVRNLRFYTTRGLIPPPGRKGRSAIYTADHLARLELIRELQAHGFTLAAIEAYLNRIPADASPDTIALHRTLIAPWKPDLPETVTRAELSTRAGRKLSSEDVHTLQALGVVEPVGRGRFKVAAAQLSVGIGILDLGLPHAAAVAAQQIISHHGRAVAEELTDLFHQQIWPALTEPERTREQVRSLVESFKPVTIGALVAAYETAISDLKRESAARRAQSDEADRAS